jgi:hypothetical protein
VGRGTAHRTVSARCLIPDGPGSQAASLVFDSGQAIPLADDPLATSLAEALTHLQPDAVWERALSAASGFAV